jgi:multiple sugar transport system substrate-binding protein
MQFLKSFKVNIVVWLVLACLPLSLNAQEGVTLTFFARDSGRDLVEQVIAKWNETHSTRIEATYVPYNDFMPKLSAVIASGESPDILAIDLIAVPLLASQNQLTDISTLAESLPFYDKLSPSHMRLGAYDGVQYALPFTAEGSVLIYNKDLFAQAGLDPDSPPTTWAQISEYAQAVDALGDNIHGYYFSGACAGCNAFTFLPFIWANGGDILNEDGTEAQADTPEVRAALEFYRSLWEAGVIPSDAQTDDGANFLNAFAAGNIGISTSGAFSIAALKSGYPDINFGIAPIPGTTEGSSSFAGGDSIAIPAGSRYVEEAFEFITWALSDEVQVEIIAKGGGLPVRIDQVENEYSAADERYVTVGNAMYTGRTPYVIPYVEIFNNPNGAWLAMIQKAVFEGDIDGAIAEAQAQMNDILSQY